MNCRRLLSCCVAFGLLVAGSAALADEMRPQITVDGTAVTRVQPDMIVWSITVSETAEQPGPAKEKVDQWVAELFDTRDRLDIEEDDFQTGQASVQRVERRNPRTGETEFVGYEVSRSITIKQRDLEQFDAFLAAFAKPGHEFNMQLMSSGEDEIRRDTRIEAVKAAKAKAEELAAALGVGVGMPLQVQASEGFPRPMAANNRVMMAEMADGGGSSFTPGAIEIRVQVNATFQLVELSDANSAGVGDRGMDGHD